jgi:hypothetical protein
MRGEELGGIKGQSDKFREGGFDFCGIHESGVNFSALVRLWMMQNNWAALQGVFYAYPYP